MVHPLEDIKCDGGSVEVGSTGTISALMSRELNSNSTVSSKPKFPKPTSLVPNTASLDKASSSQSSENINQENLELSCTAKQNTRKTGQIPMLVSSDSNISSNRSPCRGKSEKRGPYIVEIVDIKCGNPNRAWAAPITNQIKKLGFSKLSNSII